MTQIFRSVTALAVGAALAVFGLAHTLNHFPDPAAFAELSRTMPSLLSVLLFALGALAVVVGLLVLVTSSRRLRRQWQQLRRLTAATPRRAFHPDDGDYDGEPAERDWGGAYR